MGGGQEKIGLLISITKLYASHFDKVLESIFCILLAVEVLSLLRVLQTHKEAAVSWEVDEFDHEQNFIVSSSPVCSPFEALAVGSAVRYGHGEDTNRRIGPSLTSVGFYASRFTEHTSQMWWFSGIETLWWVDWQQTVLRIFWYMQAFWSFSAQPLSWSLMVVIYNPLLVSCHNLVRKWLVILKRVTGWKFKSVSFKKFLVTWWGPHWIFVFTFSNLIRMSIDHSVVHIEFLATSSMVVRASASVINHRQVLTARLLGSSSSRPSSPLQNIVTHLCLVCALAVSEPNASLMLLVVYTALPPVLNWNKEMTSVCLLSKIISML